MEKRRTERKHRSAETTDPAQVRRVAVGAAAQPPHGDPIRGNEERCAVLGEMYRRLSVCFISGFSAADETFASAAGYAFLAFTSGFVRDEDYSNFEKALRNAFDEVVNERNAAKAAAAKKSETPKVPG